MLQLPLRRSEVKLLYIEKEEFFKDRRGNKEPTIIERTKFLPCLVRINFNFKLLLQDYNSPTISISLLPPKWDAFICVLANILGNDSIILK